MNLFDNDTLLARWLSGELSKEEREALERHPDFPAFQRLVAATDKLALPDAGVQAMWERLSQQIENQPKKQVAIRRRMIWWLAVAAALAGLLVFAWPFFQAADGTPTIVSTGPGEQKTVNLPDGSTVRLNAASELQIFNKNWSRKRRLQLKGEAVFDVQHNPAAPFEVEAGGGSVTVLGTIFSIKSRQNIFEVACYRGAVKAVSYDAYEQVVKAGQKTSARNGVQDWQPVQPNAETAPAWASGQSRFDNESLREVLNEVERQFGVTVNSVGTENRFYTGTFPNNNLELALRLVCDPLNLQYQIEGKVVNIQPK